MKVQSKFKGDLYVADVDNTTIRTGLDKILNISQEQDPEY